MTHYSPTQLEALTNHDGLLFKPPFKTDAERRQYYSRYLSRYLWRYLTPADWHTLAEIIDSLKISANIKRATKFLLPRHLG